VVVGAGPVGLIAALGLVRRGIEVTVVERGERPNDSPRAAAYHYPVLEVMADVGILEDVEAAGIRIQENRLWHRPTGEVFITDQGKLAGRVPYPYNVNLGQGELSQIVLTHLQRHPGATMRWSADVVDVEQDSAGAAAVLADGERIRGDWLIGADGARSLVRKAVGLGFDGFTWDDRFVATNIRYPFDRYGYGGANLILDPEVGCIVAQLTKDGLWRVTFAEDDALPEEEIPQRIDDFMQRFLPSEPGPDGRKDFELVAYSPYRMHQRSAESYRVGRVLLAGDAAHVTNPTGALGLTGGLLDVDVLVPALAAVAAGTASEEVLDAYSDARRTKFLEHTSPFASDFKRLVYGGSERDLREAFEAWKSQADTEEKEIEFLLGIGAIRSEQVV